MLVVAATVVVATGGGDELAPNKHTRSMVPVELHFFKTVFGFAVFIDQPSALAALHTLNGLVFDLEKGSTLHIDLAKSNSRSKRSREDERHGSDKRAKGSSSFSRIKGHFRPCCELDQDDVRKAVRDLQ
ncbi:hypothetical protein L2E82_05250 [Cichorium intybus]|uniref:Uncharacterized protein n=1 Tax=Cichorium intybus TaxID=13427 RepID=A0ACB9H8I9_CICIN|nr:hypothetical protein L2E82_05250 [Cichorium intybus]